MPAEPGKIKDVFLQALESCAPGEWSSFLDAACAGDAELRRRVEVLLHAHRGEDSLLDAEGGAGPATAAMPIGEGAGTQVGPYKLLQQIGEGGMGAVYMAEQSHPVQRRVALKIIKPGMDSRSVLARFEAERQALALMDHPNIAKVLDAGATDAGRPYFVMELVKGVPITRYCDERHLTPRRRLELFAVVCHAVQHAHQKGIIHRDLKPSNVLVAEYDDKPVPKVIDFGVAKATGSKLTDRTMFTELGSVVGTLEYMSPEQAKLNALDVDTRSDVYALGVLLYELLTGTPPFDRKRLRSAAFDEMLRIIREEEPQKPSTRISTTDELPSIAASRGIEPKRLSGLVRGEIDWIVMKCLEKDRNRRYETANGLAMDLHRYLADEPVQACPPSAGYRLRKFVRRNTASVVAASLVLLALAGGAIGAAWGMFQAKAAQERAESNMALAGEAVEEYLGAVTDDPDLRRSDFNRLRKRLLESALPFLRKIAEQESADPAVAAQRGLAYQRLASVRLAMGEYETALKDAEAGQAIFARLAADWPADPRSRLGLALSLKDLAFSLNWLGRRDEAESAYRRSLGLLEDHVAAFPDDLPQRRRLADVSHDFGQVLRTLGKRGEAEKAMQRSLAIHAGIAAEFPNDATVGGNLAQSHAGLGNLLADLGKHADAEAAFRRGLEIHAKLAAQFPADPEHRRRLALHLGNLSNLFHNMGKLPEAESFCRRKLDVQEKLVADFPSMPEYQLDLAGAHHNLGLLMDGYGKLDEAEAAVRRTLSIREKLAAAYPAAPEYRQSLADSINSLAIALTKQGKIEAAEAAHRRAFEVREGLAADYPNTPKYAVSLGGSYSNFGMLMIAAGRHEAALGWFQKAIERLESVLSHEPRHAKARAFLRNTRTEKATALAALGRVEEALKEREETLAINRSLLGPHHSETTSSMIVLVDNLNALRRHDDALRLNKEVLENRRLTLGPDHPETLGAMANIATEYALLGRQEDARKQRAAALELMRAKTPDHVYVAVTMSNLGLTYAKLGRHAEALKIRQEALAWRKAKQGLDHPDTLESAFELAPSLFAGDRDAEAVALIDDAVRRAAGKRESAGLVPKLIDLRARHFQKVKDVAGVRATAEMWERLDRRDAGSLYDAACWRAAVAAMLRAAGGDASKNAAAEADRAMEWLKKAVAAGFKDAAHLKRDRDLDALRDRDDFKRLSATLAEKGK